MTGASNRTLVRLTRMAEMRAAGLGWPAVARELGVREETCRQWVREYPGRGDDSTPRPTAR